MNDKAFPIPASMRILERGWLSSNNVLFIGRDETALVDTGYLSHVPQTLALVEHELGGRRLDRVLNTHLHSDHCGGNAALKARYGSRIAIPVAEAARVRAWDEDALSFKATGQQCERFTHRRRADAGRRAGAGRHAVAGAWRAGARSAFGDPVLRAGGHPDFGRRAVAQRLWRDFPGARWRVRDLSKRARRWS